MSQYKAVKIILILIVSAGCLKAQEKTTELRMIFPGIYFTHNSTDYAKMPYTVDSCFKYIAANINDIYSFIIWRDANETEKLTNARIQKLKADLNNYTPSDKVVIESMGKEQKISEHIIAKAVDSQHGQYLLSLNSVFDVSKTRIVVKRKWRNKSHLEFPRPWCFSCWRHRFYIKERRQIKAARAQDKAKRGS